MPSADGINIEIADDGLREWVARAADKAGTAGRSRLLDAVGAELEARIEQRFDTKKDPSGATWAPLAESTKLRYKAQDKGRRRGTLLERSRLMRNSLTHQVQPDSVLIGFGIDRAAYHELGTRKMPRRGLLMAEPATGALGAGDKAAVETLLGRFFGDL